MLTKEQKTAYQREYMRKRRSNKSLTSEAGLTEKGLTAKQAAFCAAYVRGDWNATQAAIQAGYSPRSARFHASRLLTTHNVRERIAAHLARLESEAIGTVAERKRRLTEIYRANLTDFVDENGNITLKPSAAVAELVVEEHDGEASLWRTKRLKLRDPVAAIQEHNRMERIGQHDTIINNLNDNRSVTIIVKSEEGKRALEALKSGKLPGGTNAIEQG